MILLEAMAAGKPVIGTNVGGIPDVIDDGVNGWLVPPENPELLSRSIAKVLSDPRILKEFGLKAQQTVTERYSATASVESLITIYNNVL